MLTLVGLTYHTPSPYLLLVLAVFSLALLVRILIRALSANPLIRNMILSHIIWKTSSLPARFPILMFTLSTSLPAIRAVAKYWNSQSSPDRCGRCYPELTILRPFPLLVASARLLTMFATMVVSALLLCCAYCLWEHDEPVVLAALSVGMFAFSQCMVDIGSQRRRIYEPPRIGEAKESPLPTPLDDLVPIDESFTPWDQPRKTVSSSCTCDRVTKTGFLTVATSFSLDVVVYASQGISACAWLLLWRDLDAHTVVLYGASIHHRMLA